MADDEDFEPQEFSVNKSDKWEGEDEDDNDVKARENFLSSYFKTRRISLWVLCYQDQQGWDRTDLKHVSYLGKLGRRRWRHGKETGAITKWNRQVISFW